MPRASAYIDRDDRLGQRGLLFPLRVTIPHTHARHTRILGEQNMATIVLRRTGQKMPLVGLGLWKVPNEDCADTVYNAIKAGARLLDCAGDYGNEKEVGDGVRRALRDGLVKREELFITSKLWNTFHAHDYVRAAAKLQLSHWGIDYFDLYLVHFPISLKYVDPAKRYPPGWYGEDNKVHLQNTPYQETWRAMEELVDEGLARNIGMSNVTGGLILDVLTYARIPPQVIQVELHPYLTQQALVNLTKVLGIALTAYSSYGPQGYYEMGFDGAKTLMEQPAVVKARPQNLDRSSKENLDCNSFDLTEAEIEEIGKTSFRR